MKVLFASHDPGGANVLAPIIHHTIHQGHTVSLVLLNAAEKMLGDFKAQYFNMESTQHKEFKADQVVALNDVKQVLDETKPDAVFTSTSLNSNLEFLFITEAKARNIQNACMLDFWGFYSPRFFREEGEVLPDVLFVTDEKMKRDCLEELGKETQVKVVGNPHLQMLASRIESYGEPTNNKFCFLSQDHKLYYPNLLPSEFEVVVDLLEFLMKELDGFEFLIRAHPKEDKKPWEKFVANFNTEFDSGKYKLNLDQRDFQDLLEDQSYNCIGISSMALLEASTCGIPTYSYQVGMEAPEYNLHIPFEEYGVIQITKPEDYKQLTNPSQRSVSKGGSSNNFSIFTQWLEGEV